MDFRTEEQGGRRRLAAEMARAATTWLDLLAPGQHERARGAVPTADEADGDRRRWFYTPVDHGGLALHQQRPAQQQAALRLVAAGLSREGYVTVATIIGLENVLDGIEGFIDHGGGRERYRDPGLYYLRVFGDPGGLEPWGWRFGGHHISLNNLVVDGVLVSSTPLFLGANPAVAPLLGGTELRPLAAVEDLARDLVASLPVDLRRSAVRDPVAPDDITTRNDSTLSATAPVGVPASALDAGQRETLQALIETYLDRVPPEASPAAHYSDPTVLDAVHLSWAGPIERGAPHYYRLQGPGLLIEWDNTQNGANHAHSVWRDPEADFGLDVLRRHRAAHHR